MSEPLSDEHQKQAATTAKDYFVAVEKLRSTSRLFGEEHENIARFKESMVSILQKGLTEVGEIPLRISTFEIHVGTQTVYENREPADSLAYRFFQDGIKQIAFHSNITVDEIHEFAGICEINLDDPKYFGYDSVSLLWEAEFEGISYVVVESIAESGSSNDDDSSNAELSIVERIDEVMSNVLGGMDTDSDDIALNIQISEEDIRLVTEETDVIDDLQTDQTDVEGDAGTTLAIDSSFRDEAQRRLIAEEQALVDRQLEAITELIANAPSEGIYDQFLSRFSEAANRVVKTGHVEAFVRVLDMAFALDNQLVNRRVSEDIGHCLGDDVLMNALRNRLEQDVKNTAKSVAFVLSRVPSDHSATVLAALAEIKHPKLRAKWIAFHLRLPTFDHAACRDQIADLDAETMLAVIGALTEKPSGRAEFAVAKLMEHPSPKVRRTAIDASAKITSPSIAKARLARLTDDDPEVRERALRHVQNLKDRKAIAFLKEQLADQEFVQNRTNEAVQYMRSFAAIAQDDALGFITTYMNMKRSRFNKKSDAFHLLAVVGLSAITSNRATKLLAQIAQDKGRSKTVRQEATEQLEKIKQRLLKQKGSK